MSVEPGSAPIVDASSNYLPIARLLLHQAFPGAFGMRCRNGGTHGEGTAKKNKKLSDCVYYVDVKHSSYALMNFVALTRPALCAKNGSQRTWQFVLSAMHRSVTLPPCRYGNCKEKSPNYGNSRLRHTSRTSRKRVEGAVISRAADAC